MSTQTADAQPPTAVPDDDVLPVDDGIEDDSAYGASTGYSETTSVSSSIYRGVIEHGRRYQSYKEGEYHVPADEKQFESINALHLVCVVLESDEKNPLFMAPIPETAQNILDVGTGTGCWAVAVADRLPQSTIYGVDLYPPPETWVPPNCILEVDDITKPWTWGRKFDLVHARFLLGAFTDTEWTRFYEQAYRNLAPGGWIEQIEVDAVFSCDDGSVSEDNVIYEWAQYIIQAGANSGKRLDTMLTMREKIEAAGFVNVHQKDRKAPVGPWAKGSLYKDVGRLQLESLKAGLEGYGMFLMCRFGSDHLWTPEEVYVYLARVRAELDKPSNHIYQKIRRVWAQKPFDKAPSAEEVPATAS